MSRGFYIAIMLFATSGAGWAQPGQIPHTPAEERACRGDANRFCKDAASDEFRVAGCLHEHHDQLSRPCRAVLDNGR